MATARQGGLDVRQGGIELLDGESESFDAITMNHVLEHLHDPTRVLRACHRLLKDGGQLWLSTPNIDSYGHRIFGKDWRGLEAPRHLVLFGPDSLNRALRDAGFGRIRWMPQQNVYQGMFRASHAIKRGRLPEGAPPAPLRTRALAALARACGLLARNRREFLTATAFRLPAGRGRPPQQGGAVRPRQKQERGRAASERTPR